MQGHHHYRAPKEHCAFWTTLGLQRDRQINKGPWNRKKCFRKQLSNLSFPDFRFILSHSVQKLDFKLEDICIQRKEKLHLHAVLPILGQTVAVSVQFALLLTVLA